MAGKLGAVSSDDDDDDFSPFGETSRDEAKEGLVVFIVSACTFRGDSDDCIQRFQ